MIASAYATFGIGYRRGLVAFCALTKKNVLIVYATVGAHAKCGALRPTHATRPGGTPQAELSY